MRSQSSENGNDVLRNYYNQDYVFYGKRFASHPAALWIIEALSHSKSICNPVEIAKTQLARGEMTGNQSHFCSRDSSHPSSFRDSLKNAP